MGGGPKICLAPAHKNSLGGPGFAIQVMRNSLSLNVTLPYTHVFIRDQVSNLCTKTATLNQLEGLKRLYLNAAEEQPKYTDINFSGEHRCTLPVKHNVMNTSLIIQPWQTNLSN